MFLFGCFNFPACLVIVAPNISSLSHVCIIENYYALSTTALNFMIAGASDAPQLLILKAAANVPIPSTIIF